MWIGKYLMGSKGNGMIYTQNPSKGLEVYGDADFLRGWNPENTGDANSVYS